MTASTPARALARGPIFTVERALFVALGVVVALGYFMFAVPANAHAGLFDASQWKTFFNDWKGVGIAALSAGLFILGVVIFVRTKSAAALFGFLLMGALAIIVGQAVVNSSGEIEKSVKTDLINPGGSGGGRP